MEHYFKPPPPFSPGSSETQNVGQAWKDWKQQFEVFLTAVEKDSQGEVKVAMLLCADADIRPRRSTRGFYF